MKTLPAVTVPVVGAPCLSLVGVTVRAKLQVPVSPRRSLSVPDALYMPARKVSGAVIFPEEDTFNCGAPFDSVYVTAPFEPETTSWSEKAVPAPLFALVGLIWVRSVPATVRVKLQLPLSPRRSLAEPAAL